MAKKETVTADVQTIDITEASNNIPVDVIAIKDNLSAAAINNFSNDEYLEKASQLDTEVLQEITAEYLELKENSRYDAIYHGTREMEMADRATGEMKAVPVVDLETEQGNFISGGKVLVSACRRLLAPCYIRIETKEKERGQKGDYMGLSVYKIPAPTVD